MESNKSCHDFVSRDAISVAEWNVGEKTEIVIRFYKSCDLNYRDAILTCKNISYLIRSWFQKQGLRFWRAKVRF